METSAFAKNYIFDPLGMNDTHFHDNPDLIVKNRAYGYSPKKEGGYRLDILRLKVIGDLGVFTTVEDFLKWDQNFYENKLGGGTQSLIDMMKTRGKLNSGEEIPYAFGLNISHYGGLRIVSHGGSAVGYVAQYMQFPDQRFSVVILSNLSTFGTGRIARKTPRQRQRPRGERPKPVKLSSSQLQTYIGNYYSDELDITYTLVVESNNLVLKLRETSSILAPYSADNFGWGRRRMEFKRDKDKKIIGFILQAGRVKNLKFQKRGK
jgi:CubicO group peptidase (beta-lactamase class C family)